MVGSDCVFCALKCRVLLCFRSRLACVACGLRPQIQDDWFFKGFFKIFNAGWHYLSQCFILFFVYVMTCRPSGVMRSMLGPQSGGRYFDPRPSKVILY